MTKNRTTWVLLAGLGLLLAAGTLGAFQGPQSIAAEPQDLPQAGRMGPRGGGMLEELGLAEAQRQQMRALHNEQRKAGIRSRADLQLKRMELEELLEADEPNRPALDKTLRELNDLRAGAFKRRIEHRLAFRGLLTPEQRTKLKSFREQRGMFLRRHLRQRFMDAPGGGRGQRRGPGFVRGEGFGGGERFGGRGPGFGGGPDFDLDFEEMEPEFDPGPQL